MNLFGAIEGLREENLSTALLRILFLRSEDLREHFLAAVSAKSRVGLISAGDQFACFTEHHTSDELNGDGRLDLVIETADCVLGIENKLFAGFQPGQPEKYLGELKNRAAILRELRKRNFRYTVVVLAPRLRQAEIRAELAFKAEPERYILFEWEDVIEALGSVVTRADPTTIVIFDEFRKFLIEERLAFLRGFENWVPHLRSMFEPRGTGLHREVIRSIRQFFPLSSPSSNETSAGFYFGPSDCPDGWCGFLKRDEITQGARHDVELALVTRSDVSVSSALQHIDVRSKNFLGTGPNVHAWLINFNEEWSSRHKWAEALRPFRSAVKPDSPVEVACR